MKTSKKKYIKFVKDHTSGSFKEGQIVPVEAGSFKVWTDSEFAEKSNEDEYNQYMQEKQERLLEETREAREKHVEKIKAIDEANKKMVAEVEEAEIVEDETTQGGETLGNDLTDVPTESTNTSEELNNGLEEESEEPIFHKLTKEDVEENPTLTEGLNEGDEIEVDSEGTWLLGEDDKLIVKGK